MFACVLCFGICTLWYYSAMSFILDVQPAWGEASFCLACSASLWFPQRSGDASSGRQRQSSVPASNICPDRRTRLAGALLPTRRARTVLTICQLRQICQVGGCPSAFPLTNSTRGRTSSNVTPIGPLVPEGSTAFGCSLLEFGLVFLLWTLACNTWKVVFVHLKDLSPGRFMYSSQKPKDPSI